MEDAALAVVAVLAVLGFITWLLWIGKLADKPPEFKQNLKDLKTLQDLVADIYVRADEGREVADPGLTVIADMIDSRTRVRT